ncbi:MAG: T9SS type A sorting domain-containing protein [Elusimicrobia bacterium]|nr:T9SS type A sorting domain-containing protein [Elusimicrobiota bacterium]
MQQSVGEPRLTLDTVMGTFTSGDSGAVPVYYNKTVVSIRASNSSHFNVLWTTWSAPINGNQIASSDGWSGEINAVGPCLPDSNGLFNSLFDGPIKGFCGGEGIYYLNAVGTALVTQGQAKELLLDANLNLISLSTDSFRVFVDTTPPVPQNLEVYFSTESALAKNPDQRISSGTLWGDPDPYVTWEGRDDLGAISRSPVEGWTVLVHGSLGWQRPDRRPDQKSVFPELQGVTEPKDFYLSVRAFDRAGNWTPDTHVPIFKYQYTPDQSAPRWNKSHISMTGVRYPATDEKIRFAAVAPVGNFIDVGFDEDMLIPRDSIKLILHRSSDGTTVDRKVDLTLPTTSYVAVTNDSPSTSLVVLPFSATVNLQPASAYRFYSSTKPAPTDRANNPLDSSLDILFYTAMDPAKKAVFVSEDGKVSVDVPAYALGNDPVGMAINDRPEKVSVAGSPALPRLVDEATSAMGRQTGGAYKRLLSIKELTVFDTKGKMRSASFSGDVRLGFDVKDDLSSQNGESYIKGTSIRAKDLVLYELDERTGVWNKMADSWVDEGAGSVSAPLRHSGTYALGGSPNYDLSGAHPYPVPFRSSRDSHGITFTGLSSFGNIKILTLDGRLVKTLSFNGDSSVAWDPVESDSGDPVGSDVYLYFIENDKERVVGKLMVIR